MKKPWRLSHHRSGLDGIDSTVSTLGLLYLHGEDYKLKQLSLHSNCLDSMNHLLQCLLGVQNLREVTLSLDGKGNPVCSLSGKVYIMARYTVLKVSFSSATGSMAVEVILDGRSLHLSPPC